jgi:tetratricopeptide (TPR) repeat protein
MYSNFFIPVVGIVAERFVFVASVSFCIILVWVIFTILKTDPKNLTIEIEARIKIFGLIFLVLIPYGFLIITRNPDWRNLLDLYKTDIRKQEHSAKGNLQFGGYLMKMVYQDENFLRYGEVNQFLLMTMISHFRQALKIYPKNYQTLNDLGTVYLYMAKKYDSAQIFLEKAIALDPKLQPAWVNLGMTYRQMGKYKQAIECYNTILKNNPDQLKAVFALADVYNDMGDFNRAVNMMQEVSKKYPDLDMPYVNTGNYYMARGDTLYAVVFWEMAAQKNPTQEICLQLNYLYRLRGDSERAEYFYRLSQNAVKK